MTQVGEENIWKVVKEIRKSFLQNLGEYNTYTCILENKAIFEIYEIYKNIKSMEKKLDLKSTTIANERTSKVSLKTAAEMFTYLNYCPPHKLIMVYKHLFTTATPKDILTAIASIIRVSQNAAKESSLIIFSKVLERFELVSEKIQIITKGKCFNNGIFDNCRTKDVGKEHLKILGGVQSYFPLIFC